MEKISVDKQGLTYLKVLIECHKHKIKELYPLIENSYSAFLDYVNAKSFLSQLKNLYYILTNKEVDNES